MSLLQQNTPDLDDAARGEDFTRGTSHIVWAAVIAAIVISIAVAAYAMVTREQPAAIGHVSRATVHFVHHESKGLDAAGNPMPKEAFDQALVFSHIQIQNQSKKPLFLRQIMTNVILGDGIHTSYAAIPNDYQRVFQANPDLAALQGTPIPNDATIPPGQSVEGDFVAAFRLTPEVWNANKGINYAVSMQYQPDMILAGPAIVNVQ